MDRKPRILIAGESGQMRRNMRRILDLDEGLEVIGEVSDGEEAVRWVRQKHPDLVIMDLELPVLDGIKATQIITAEHPEVGVIVVSDEGDLELLRAAMVAGARNFLVKPYTTVELMTAIYQLIQRRPPAGGTKGTVLALYSPHGGQGRTTLAANLGVALAQDQAQVVAVDLNLQFGSLDLFLDLEPENTWQEMVWDLSELTPAQLDRYLTPHASGLKVLCAPRQPRWEEPIPAAEVQQVLALLRDPFQYILLDLSSGLDEVVLTALEEANLVMLLATQEVPSLRHISLFLDMLEEMEYPLEKVRLILNRYNDREEPRRQEIEKALKREIVWCLPDQRPIVGAAINQGQPVVLMAPKSPIARSIVGLARHLQGLGEALPSGTPETPRPRWLRPPTSSPKP
jgi:pilus assembly protein CpaE